MNKKKWIFPLALVIYAVVFLAATAVGSVWLWHYMENFEASRPDTALDAYMSGLSAEYVADRSGALIDQIDHGVQTEAECRQVLLDAMTDDFTCAKKSKLSTDTSYVYAIRCGKQVIGTMTLECSGEMVGSFRTWKVTKEEFDLSYLLTEPISVTVPENYPVYVGEKRLSADYITEDAIRYDVFSQLYEEYELPYMVTYEAGPFLGTAAFTVTDPNGNEVQIDENTDMTVFLNNCTQEQIEKADALVERFIQCYVDFTSRTGGSLAANYEVLSRYMVSGGELAKRMKDAFEGLSWVTDRGAKISSITVHNRHAMTDGRLLWDVTYVVDTRDFSGSIQTTSHIKLILTQTDAGWKAEAMKNG